MYARMLHAWPDEPSYRELSNDVDEVDPEFYNALSRLADLAKVEDGHLLKRSIHLSEEAVAGFDQFRKYEYLARKALEAGSGNGLRKARDKCFG